MLNEHGFYSLAVLSSGGKTTVVKEINILDLILIARKACGVYVKR